MGPIVLRLLLIILQMLSFVIIASAIMSWLVAFDVVNYRNRFVYQLGRFLDGVTDPMLRPLRRIVPLLGGVDITPVIALLAIWFLQQVLAGPLSPLFLTW
jgi:YggT family protein